MSHTEYTTGLLIPTGKTKTEVIKSINLDDVTEYYQERIKNLDYTDTEEVNELFSDLFYRELICIDNQVYKVSMTDYDDCDDIFEAHTNHDGSIQLTLKYYNGGCGFDEAVDYAVNKIGRRVSYG